MTSNVFAAGFAPTGLSYTIIVLFCCQLLVSYPLVLYPSHIIIETIIYSTWPKTKKRQWSKNGTRSLLVVITVVFTMLVDCKIEKLLSLNGSLFCTPVAFLFPAMFHLKACAETKFQKAIDVSIIILAFVIMVFCTILGIIDFANSEPCP